MEESERLLRRLSNFSFALAALTLFTPVALVATAVVYTVTTEREQKPSIQVEQGRSESTEDTGPEVPSTQNDGSDSGGNQNKPMPGWVIALVAGAFLLIFTVLITFAFVLTIVAPAVLGWQLRTRRRYDLALAAAALSCGHIPFGTVLGGWTISVLVREPVRALFADRAAVPASEDDELYLKLLSRFHSFVSVANGAYCLYPIAFIPVLATAGLDPQLLESPPRVVGLAVFMAFGALLLLWWIAVCVCTWLAGRYLQQHRRRAFCLAVAAVNCMAMPHGTILGGFTILVLSRPSAQLLFESPSASPPPIAAPVE